MSLIIDRLKLTSREERATCSLGNWNIESSQAVEVDWHYYSKSWHRSHGPKVSVTERELTFSRPYGRGVQIKRYYLNSWAGDFVARAVDSLGLSPKKPNYNLKIRLNKAYDAKIIDRKRGYTIYSRTLLGEHYDYVIQSPLGMIYHDDARANLIKGLHKKIRSRSRKLKGAVDWVMCKKLGFCDEGIRAFCDQFNFDTSASYLPQEIEREVRKNPGLARPFIGELKTLASALNYQITI